MTNEQPRNNERTTNARFALKLGTIRDIIAHMNSRFELRSPQRKPAKRLRWGPNNKNQTNKQWTKNQLLKKGERKWQFSQQRPVLMN